MLLDARLQQLLLHFFVPHRALERTLDGFSLPRLLDASSARAQPRASAQASPVHVYKYLRSLQLALGADAKDLQRAFDGLGCEGGRRVRLGLEDGEGAGTGHTRANRPAGCGPIRFVCWVGAWLLASLGARSWLIHSVSFSLRRWRGRCRLRHIVRKGEKALPYKLFQATSTCSLKSLLKTLQPRPSLPLLPRLHHWEQTERPDPKRPPCCRRPQWPRR